MDRIDDVDKYVDAWIKTQLDIWKEKVSRLGVVRSGALYNSFNAAIDALSSGRTITMRFLQYGIYQALGTGPEFTKNNGGDLPFLGREYRETHGLNKPRKVGPRWGGYMTSGNPRKPRDWYSKKLYMSTMAMVEDLARILGENIAHVVCEELTDPRKAIQ